jgi:hypothetical protein
VHVQRDAGLAVAEQGAGAVGQTDFEQAALQFFEQFEDRRVSRARLSPPRRIRVLFILSIPVGVVAGWAPRKGTPLSHSFSACQWMRAMTPRVRKGMRRKAPSSAAADQSRGLPEMEVSSSSPSASS